MITNEPGSVIVGKAGTLPRALANVELALFLRQLSDGASRDDVTLAREAARRLEVLAMERGECQVYEVYLERTWFAEPPPRLDWALKGHVLRPADRRSIETPPIAPGEHTAFDRFGEIIIVKRVP